MDSFAWDSLVRDCFQQKYILIVGNDVMLEEDIYRGNSNKYLSHLCDNYKDPETGCRMDLKDFLRCVQIPLDKCNHKLQKLLSLKLFRVVITTTTDDLLERVMKEIWGDKLQIINFCDEEKRNIFKPGEKREFDLTTPTLCYAFGKIGNQKYAYDDDDKLEIIADWLNPGLDNYPRDFYSYIQNIFCLF